MPSGIAEYILPNNLTVSQALQSRQAGGSRAYAAEAVPQGLIYRPAILAQASIRYLNRKYNLDYMPQKRPWWTLLTGGCCALGKFQRRAARSRLPGS